MREIAWRPYAVCRPPKHAGRNVLGMDYVLQRHCKRRRAAASVLGASAPKPFWRRGALPARCFVGRLIGTRFTKGKSPLVCGWV